MTNREFFTAIANLETVPSELRQFALEGIEKLDARNASRQAKPTKAQIENASLYPSVLALLNENEPTLSTVVASALGVSTSKATGLLGNLYKDGKVDKVDVSVKGKGKQKGWLLIVSDTDLPADEQIFIGEVH